MSDKAKEEFEAWHSEQVSRLFEHGESTAASVWAGFKSLLEITWKASRAKTPPQPIYDEAKERELFEQIISKRGWSTEKVDGFYSEPYAHYAWSICLEFAQSRAKAGEDE